MICGSEGVALGSSLGGENRGKAHNVRKEHQMTTAPTHSQTIERVSASVQLLPAMTGGDGDA
jgi:hypothetical protein